MERNARIATWTGAILGVSLALLLNVALAHGADATEEFHHTYPLAANGRVELQNINGAVHIAAWDQNEVKVDAVKRASSEERLKDAEIRVDARADSIAIETHYREEDQGWHGAHNDSASVEYTVMVPRNARLDEIKLINGGLDVTGVSGEVRASCINGPLKVRGLAGRAKLATINGPLDADFERLSTDEVELSSVNGPLDLTMPSDAKARIEASTVHGGIDNDFGLHTNDHHFVGHDMHGELGGGGGAEIKLNNVNGTISVHHAKDGRGLSPANDSEHDSGDSI